MHRREECLHIYIPLAGLVRFLLPKNQGINALTRCDIIFMMVLSFRSNQSAKAQKRVLPGESSEGIEVESV
ncbi:hypothetical protein IFM47457_05549 [Aspergillus lentulus]|nr:hypothetical protein IFM47457_05549 [Aspergillus lentulus]